MNNRLILKRLILFLVILFLVGCAIQTPYLNHPVNTLTDNQLLEELEACVQGQGIEVNRSQYFMASSPGPAYVMTSSTTSFVGQYSGVTNAYVMPRGYGYQYSGSSMGTVSGNAHTTYQYVDANAYARNIHVIAAAISQANAKQYRDRGRAVLKEIQNRVESRRSQVESAINQFFVHNPELSDKKNLISAVLPWVAAEKGDSLDALGQAKKVIQGMERGRCAVGDWYGAITQETTMNSGERSRFSNYIKIRFRESENGIVGPGLLGTGDNLVLLAECNEGRISGKGENLTHGLSFIFQGRVGPSQMTTEFIGSGAGQSFKGQGIFLR